MADIENLPYHRKYRPSSFDDYIGNEKMKESIFRNLSSGKRPQIIMMTGDSGCGKTTMARLLAKEYSCEHRDDVTGACGVCASCETISDYIATGDTSILTNIREVNVSDQSGKNDLNDVLEDMQIPAFGDEWKVYIFDECHKASDGLQNALLKIVEEPPAQVLMIFCTTNPERMIETFRNRVQLELKVSKPSVKELGGLLKKVCDTEGVEYDTKGLEFIANRGELTIRTALQNLQKVVNEQGSAKYDNAIKVFDEIANTIIIDFFKALKKRDTLSYVTILTNIKKKMELSLFITELKNFVKRGIYTLNGIQQDGVSDNELYVYQSLFGDLSITDICGLLSKILSFRQESLELELIMWGYTGLVAPKETNNDGVDIPVIPLENEISAEIDNANKQIKAQEKATYEQGIKNAEKLMKPVGIEDILSLGATLVQD